MAKLIVVQGSQERALTLSDGVHVIGRSSRCSVYIQDVAASREHCKLVVQGTGITLVDEGSRNGTLLNGRRAGTEQLKAGDVIRIGDTVIHVEFKRGDSEPSRSTQAERPATSGTTVRARAVVKDYSIWSAGSMPRIARRTRQALNYLALLGLVGLLAAIGFVVGRRGGGRSAAAVNKIQRNASFSADPAGQWTAKGDSVRIFWDRGIGRAAVGSLVIEKIRPEAGAEIGYQAEISVNSRRRLDGEVWARSEGYKGSAAVSVTWMDRGQRTIAFDVSPFAEVKNEWTLIRGDFHPPAGASFAKVGVALWGGGTGRIFLDDVQILNELGAEKGTQQDLGDYSVYTSRRSLSQVFWWKSLLLATNVRLEFVGKEGAIASMGVEPLRFRREGMERMEVAGSFVWPLGGQPVPFQQTMSFENGELVTAHQLSIPPGQQIDEVHLLMELPRIDRIAIPEGGVARSILLQQGNHEFEISYGEPVTVSRSDERGTVLLRQEYAVQGESVVFGWSLRETSTTAEVMVRKLREDLTRVGEDRLGLRRSILTRLKDRLRELEEIHTVTRQIDEIGRMEAAEWSKVQIEARVALMSGRPERAELALKQIQAFLDRFEDTRLSQQVQEVSKDLTVLLTGAQADERTLGRRFMEMAEKHIQSGKDDIARGILSVVAARWGSDEIGQEARRLLDSLKK